MSKVLVFKEKHGDRYFAADTQQQINAAFLTVMRERLNEGWYEDTHDLAGRSVPTNEGQLELLGRPRLSVKATAEALLAMDDQNEQLELAETFMRNRKRAEYEEWFICEVETA